MGNKVEFGFSNVHYAPLTDEEKATYGAYVEEPGGVTANWEPSGGRKVFRADNKNYKVTYSNTGGTLTLEMAKFSNEFLVMTGLYKLDKNGALVELGKPKPTQFALAFDIDGDVKERHNVFYNCVASLPSGSASTTEEGSNDPKTQAIEISYSTIEINGEMMTRSSIEVIASIEGNADAYENFFDEVYKPVFEEAAPNPS